MMFWSAWRATYLGSRDFLIALPVLGLLIVGVEGAQHIVEGLHGMYSGRAGFAAAAHDPQRLLTGTLKVFWLYAVQFWVTRYLVSGSGSVAVRAHAAAIRKFAVVFAFSALLALAIIWIPALFPDGSRAQHSASGYAGVLELASFPLELAIAPWVVGAALGDSRAGLMFASRRAWGSIWWGVGLTLVAILPLMILHYLLGYSAVGKPAAVTIVLLMLDAALVGYLGVVTAAVNVAIAERMAVRAGDRLLVDPA